MKAMTDDHGDWLHEVRRDERLDRIWELEAEVVRLRSALRDLLMENASYTRVEAARLLGLCVACYRDKAVVGECSLCQDGRREDERETA